MGLGAKFIGGFVKGLVHKPPQINVGLGTRQELKNINTKLDRVADKTESRFNELSGKIDDKFTEVGNRITHLEKQFSKDLSNIRADLFKLKSGYQEVLAEVKKLNADLKKLDSRVVELTHKISTLKVRFFVFICYFEICLVKNGVKQATSVSPKLCHYLNEFTGFENLWFW